MGRKRNQGKARRAAKAAKAAEEAEDGASNNQAAEGSLAAQRRRLQLQIGEGGEKCDHGYHTAYKRDFHPFSSKEEFVRFIDVFCTSFLDIVRCGKYTVSKCLTVARKATMNEFAEVWKDAAKLEITMSHFLFVGTHDLLRDNFYAACKSVTIARYFEQYIAVVLKQTQALINWPKLGDAFYADEHTVVKFLRHRIPCSCLDEKYQEVKHITKMGCCNNPKCKYEGGEVERSKTKYCSRCRCAVYCSRECQVADWSRHKPACNQDAAIIAEFEAR